MNKMSTEVMEQLLKDLAANVGYELIANPFDTPFGVRDNKTPFPSRFAWPVPASVLKDEGHKERRKAWVDSELIDAVVELSWPWPYNEDEQMALILIDVRLRRRGNIKFVDASFWNIEKEEGMAAVCNMIIHDIFPGENHLAFLLDESLMDSELDYRWNEQVCLVTNDDVVSGEVVSLQPMDYIVKPDRSNKCLLSDVCDIECSMDPDKVLKLEGSAIVLSAVGKLNPKKIVYEGIPVNVPLKDTIVLVPDEGIDIEYVLRQFSSEEVLRQLPITRRIFFEDMWHLLIDTDEKTPGKEPML